MNTKTKNIQTILDTQGEHLLRSGKTYKNTMTTDSKTPTTSHISQQPITILHDESKGPKFTGIDSDGVTVYQFIRDCEDIIRKRQLTQDQDKTNILRERISNEPCPARSISFSDIFLQCKNYEDFKKTIIKTFASTSK